MRTTSLLLLLAAPLLASCTTFKAYRSDFQGSCNYATAGDCARSALTVAHQGTDAEYALAFIEHDEQGYLLNAEAKRAVMQAYREQAAANDILLVVFVHGWHHNAKGRPEDDNITSFRDVLAKAAAHEASRSKKLERPGRKVLGVYMGWRGESIAVPGLNYAMTFWSRKAVAHEVGQQGMTTTLLELEEIAKGNPRQHPDSKLITIGHSFGGAALFSALNQVLQDRYVKSRPFTSEAAADGFGDLVLLLNPAFEAMRYGALYDLSQSGCRAYPKTQLPRLVILSSGSDFPVHILFQGGRFLSTRFEHHRDTKTRYCSDQGEQLYDVNQGRGDVLAVGHYDPYVTHFLDVKKGTPSSFAPEGGFDASQTWLSQMSSGRVYFKDAVLTAKGRTLPLNPYLNIFTTGAAISGHNDIWNPTVLSFVDDLISIAATAEAGEAGGESLPTASGQ